MLLIFKVIFKCAKIIYTTVNTNVLIFHTNINIMKMFLYTFLYSSFIK